jgi:hypothetical protein
VPILPIDLQTLFGQSLQVGKEQAVQKEASPQAQSAQGAQMVQKTEVRDSSVNETPPEEEGPEHIKDRARRGAERRRRQAGKKQPPQPPSSSRGVLSDPALGRNVDITG